MSAPSKNSRDFLENSRVSYSDSKFAVIPFADPSQIELSSASALLSDSLFHEQKATLHPSDANNFAV